MDLNGTAWNRVDSNELAQERKDWHALIKKHVNIRVKKWVELVN